MEVSVALSLKKFSLADYFSIIANITHAKKTQTTITTKKTNLQIWMLLEREEVNEVEETLYRIEIG